MPGYPFELDMTFVERYKTATFVNITSDIDMTMIVIDVEQTDALSEEELS